MTLFLFVQFNYALRAQIIKEITYKPMDTTSLNMVVHYPANLDANLSYPAMVFFFGGGWAGGSTEQFEPHAA